MRMKSALALLASIAALAACASVGQYEVRVESGNQTSGYLSRPTGLTTSSDAAVQEVAQRVCDGVKRGSVAEVTFVGNVPDTGPVSLADRARYHYDCKSTMPAPAPALASPVVPAATTVAAPAAATAAPATTAASAPPAGPLTDAQEQHRRECQRRQGSYQICVGSCLASSSSASGVVEAECARQCAPQAPVGCN